MFNNLKIQLTISIGIWILFLQDNKLEILDYIRNFLLVTLLTIAFDLTWLTFHFYVYIVLLMNFRVIGEKILMNL